MFIIEFRVKQILDLAKQAKRPKGQKQFGGEMFVPSLIDQNLRVYHYLHH